MVLEISPLERCGHQHGAQHSKTVRPGTNPLYINMICLLILFKYICNISGSVQGSAEVLSGCSITWEFALLRFFSLILKSFRVTFLRTKSMLSCQDGLSPLLSAIPIPKPDKSSRFEYTLFHFSRHCAICILSQSLFKVPFQITDIKIVQSHEGEPIFVCPL